MNKNCSFLIFLIIILINLLIINYVIKLEKKECACSSHWKRDYIKYYSMLTVLLAFFVLCISLSLNITSSKSFKKIIKSPLFKSVYILYFIAGVINIWALFTYSQNIVISKCKCSESWERSVIYYYSMIIVSVYIFISILLLLEYLCNTKLKL
jgi:hypothetical protein